jgi:two-component system copper resistance phosphate regulon response regulator CusR
LAQISSNWHTVSTQLLLVEDDVVVAEVLRQALLQADYQVTWASTGEEGFFLAISQAFDVMLLDMGLPGRSGLDVLNAVRLQDKALPVMILSSQSETGDRVTALRAGADDYLVKPCSLDELDARLQCLLRRNRPAHPLRLVVHDLSMDLACRLVIRAGQAISTTRLEFDLLELLMKHAHAVVSRETLASEVWHQVSRATPIDNIIDVHMGRLRRKIDLPDTRPLIHTIRGVGFMLTDKNYQ